MANRAGEEPTRDRLVRAGVALLRELTPADLVGLLRTRDITKAAGVGQATFFHHFADTSAYADAVLAHLYSVDRWDERMERLSDQITTIRTGSLPVELGYTHHANELARLTSDPEFRIRLGLWALGGPGTDEAYGEFLRSLERRSYDVTTAVFASWGRDFRSPFDAASYIAMTVSFLQGAAVRHLVDPESMSVERFRTTAVGLTLILLRLTGDHRTMDDRLSELNYYPGTAQQGARTADRRDSTRTRVIDAAAELFGAYGYDTASISQIAKRAEVNADTVYELFQTKARLGLALLEQQAADHFASRPDAGTRAEDDDGAPSDQLVRRHLRHLAEFTATHSELSRLYLAALTGHEPWMADDPVRATTRDLVAAAQAEGTLRADLEAVDLADLLLSTTIGRVLGRPGDGPIAVAEWAWSIVTPPG